jgi:ATP-binding cassette, subfamily B, bacterial
VKPPRLSQTVRQDGETLRRALGLIRAVAPRHAAATASLTLLGALLPAASIWLLKRIIDIVAAATHGTGMTVPAGRTALVLAGSYLLLVCLQQLVQAIARFVDAQIDDLLEGAVTQRIMEKVSLYPDLSPFESPRFHDRLELLRNGAAYRPMALFTGLAAGAQSSLTLLCMLLFLARYHPALVLALAVTAGPSVFGQRQLQGTNWFWMAEVAPLRRRLADYARVLLTAPFAKEVRLFGFSDHILARHREQFGELMACVHHARWRRVRTSIALSLLAALGVSGAFAYVINQALHGAITLGDLSLYTGALFQANAAAAGLTGALGRVYEALPFNRELFAFLDSAPTLRAPTSGRRVSPSPRHGFRLQGVSFHYPDVEHPVFGELDLEVPWGKTTALVGENGAGKSTLVKLLVRLYDPVAGRILLDGIDLREYDLEDLRRHVAVVFQDFARYHLPAWENIALGDVSRLGDRERIAEAARRSGADAVIRRLPRGEETMLGREFDGAVELSGGEWQKIALARAFMRDAPILILDEPTAALDARSEYEMYCRFLELAAGRTTLLISHRFSTVRMADHILVLEGGVVIEEGDHRSLVVRGGRYAELYAMQAERYGA